MGRAEREEYLLLLEEQHRRAARADLNAYCRYIEIPGAPLNEEDPECEQFYPDTVTPAVHHELINNTLMDVESGKLKRLMIFMPPGSAKSTYATVVFPTWFMGKKRGRNVISTSYGSELATRFGRKCRQITKSKQFKEVFNEELLSDNRAADDWGITNGSTYIARGILAGITGNRADGIVIDDPIKGRADADSETIRNKVWEAYKTDIRTRLKPNGFICIIQTRWHEDDLSGRILPAAWNGQSGMITAKDGEEWQVICLQAECTRNDDPLGRKVGEWLWTDWFSPAHWRQEKKTQGERNWSALYQQCPTPSDGGIFKRNWFMRYAVAPAEPLLIVQSCDTAYKPGQINDPSVIQTWMVTRFGYYLIDVWRDRVDYPTLKRQMINLSAKWTPHAILIEDKASGQSLIQELQSETRLPVIAIMPEGDKISRANGVSSIAESGLVYLPEVAPWMIDFESELFAFPLATHDDQVDSLTQFLTWAHKRSVELEAWGIGHVSAGLTAFNSESHLDTETGYGIVRSDTDTSGF